jgi:hypothetical protein
VRARTAEDKTADGQKRSHLICTIHESKPATAYVAEPAENWDLDKVLPIWLKAQNNPAASVMEAGSVRTQASSRLRTVPIWRPTFTSAVMEAIASGSKGREQMLFVLRGAIGMRIGEALGLEIEKHISRDFSPLHIRQKVWRGQIQPFLKSDNGIRDIDLPTSIAACSRSS